MSVSLRENRDLREFVLENVQQTENERVLGTGSYGSVQEVTINGIVYAAKKIHEALLETDERGGVERIAQSYLQECRLMARIRHPNITQFIGLCFLDGSRLPLLVMERLDSSLDDLLETTPNIPLSVSKYILTCVCRGLHYLHRQSVVHRDLTARNVLLTDSLQAKITDFGNSRIVLLEPGQLARTLSRVPGTMVYMPPEALSDGGHTVYGPSLDVFSFGVLQLFVLTQVFPGDLLSPTHPDPDNPDLLLAHSEFERRQTYTSLLERSLAGGCGHPLFVLVRDCLANVPQRRPTTSQLLSTLERTSTEMEEGLLQLDFSRVKTVRALKAKDKRIAILQSQLTAKNQLITDKDTLLAEKDTLLDQQRVASRSDLEEKDRQLTQQNTQFTAQLNQKDRQITILDTAMTQKEVQIQKHREVIGSKNAELARRAIQIQRLEELVRSKDHEINERRLSQPNKGAAMSTRLVQPPQELRLPLKTKWRKGKHMPFGMGDTVSVVIGNVVYVSGALVGTGRDRDCSTVLKLDLEQDRWTELPPWKVKWFAMSSFAGQLVLVGGYDPVTRRRTNQIAVLVSTSWAHPYPPMNVARHSPAVVSTIDHIVVAGGTCNQNRRLSSVEVFDVTSSTWYIADSLPNVQSRMNSKPALVGNILYLMGGYNADSLTKEVHKINLNELISRAVSMTTNKTTPNTPLWQTIENTPLTHSTPLAIQGSLLAVGGTDDLCNSSSAIHLYQPDTRTWVKVGDLPTSRYGCTCSILPSQEVIVAGGQVGTFSFVNRVDIVTVTEYQTL